MKEQAKSQSARSVVSYFSSSKHVSLDKSSQGLYQRSQGLYRGLPHQLVQHNLTIQKESSEFLQHKEAGEQQDPNEAPTSQEWFQAELQSFLEHVLTLSSTLPVIMFIDGLDECKTSPNEYNFVLSLLRQLLDKTNSKPRCDDVAESQLKPGSFKICISATPDLQVGETEYSIVMATLHVQERTKEQGTTVLPDLVDVIADKANGMFLSTKFTLDSLLYDSHRRNLEHPRKHLEAIPKALYDVYGDKLESSQANLHYDKEVISRFFQCIIFANRPFQLRETMIICRLVLNPNNTH
jgi:hypothetical protein